MSVKTICFEKEKIDWKLLRQKVHENLETEHRILMSVRSVK